MNASLTKKRNKARRDFAQFDALIAAPGDLASGFALPANAKLFVSSDASLADVQNYVTVKGQERAGNNGATAVSGMVHAIGYAEEQGVVMKSTTAQGTVSLFIDNGMGKLYLIGQG